MGEVLRGGLWSADFHSSVVARPLWRRGRAKVQPHLTRVDLGKKNARSTGGRSAPRAKGREGIGVRVGQRGCSPPASGQYTTRVLSSANRHGHEKSSCFSLQGGGTFVAEVPGVGPRDGGHLRTPNGEAIDECNWAAQAGRSSLLVSELCSTTQE